MEHGMSIETETAALVLEGVERILREGARKSRQWTYNHEAQREADVYEAMADAAKREVEMLEARHD
jgi:hypothetical protein